MIKKFLYIHILFKRFQYYFSVVTLSPPMTGLAKVSEKVFGKPICKREQMSNWERRPLRLSQQHYGALDAFILVDLINKLAEDGHPKNSIDKYIKVLDNRHYKPVKCDDEDDDEGFMNQRPQTNFSENEGVNKKKHFGAAADKKKEKDFIPSQGLKPEMKAQGFIVDKNLFKVGKLMEERKIDVKIPAMGIDSDQICAMAVQENRIFITTNLRLFNKKLSMPRCCIAYKASPFNQFKAVKDFFQL